MVMLVGGARPPAQAGSSSSSTQPSDTAVKMRFFSRFFLRLCSSLARFALRPENVSSSQRVHCPSPGSHLPPTEPLCPQALPTGHCTGIYTFMCPSQCLTSSPLVLGEGAGVPAWPLMWLDHLRCIIMAQMSLEESSLPRSGVEGGLRAGSE